MRHPVRESMACALYLAERYKGPDGLPLAAASALE
jgi:glutathione S-transferase